ncbi:MAG: hypothetical protein WAM14_09660 [Candidatus Nitrosopolaris sp.]
MSTSSVNDLKVHNQNGDKGITVTMHPENHMLNIRKYKEELWTCIPFNYGFIPQFH